MNKPRGYEILMGTMLGTGKYVAHVTREVVDYFRYCFPSGDLVGGPSLGDFIKTEGKKSDGGIK